MSDYGFRGIRPPSTITAGSDSRVSTAKNLRERPWPNSIKAMHISELTADLIVAGSIESDDGNVVFNLDDSRLTFTDEDGQVRVDIGDFGASNTDWGLKVFRADGSTILDLSGLGPDTVDTDQIIAGALTKEHFEADITPVEKVTSLPAMPDADYPEGMVVYLTGDSKLYRSTGAAWTKAADGGDITAGSVTADKMDVAELSAIVGVLGTVYAGLINNLQTNPTAGIRLDSSTTKPGTWLRYIDLAGAGTDPFINHDQLVVRHNGTATFSGDLDAAGGTFGTITAGVLANGNTELDLTNQYLGFGSSQIAGLNNAADGVFLGLHSAAYKLYARGSGGFLHFDGTNLTLSSTSIAGTLAAVSGTFATITAGVLATGNTEFDLTNQYLGFGSSQTAGLNTAANGVFLGLHSAAYKLYARGSGGYIYFDGTDLTIGGDLDAAGGTFAGALDAVTGTFATITAGILSNSNTRLHLTNEYLAFGADQVGGLDTADNGIFVGLHSGAYKLYARGTGGHLLFDGTDLEISADLTGSTGAFSGSLAAEEVVSDGYVTILDSADAIDGPGLGAAGSPTVMQIGKSILFVADADGDMVGQIGFPSGGTGIYLQAGATGQIIELRSSTKLTSDLELDGAFNHDGTTFAFCGETPQTRLTIDGDAAAIAADEVTYIEAILDALDRHGIIIRTV